MRKLIFMSCLLMSLAVPAWAGTAEQEVERAQQLYNQALDLYSEGKYQKAITLLQQSLEVRERILGPYDTFTFASVVLLAFQYETMGQYEQALPLLRRAIEISEKSLDPDVQVGVSFNYEALARVYTIMGRYEQALPLYQHVLEMKEKDFGHDYPSLTVSTIEKLAELYQILGQYDQALALMQRALAINEKKDPYSFNMARSLNGLADIYQSMGQHKKAQPLYQRVLDIRKKILDPNDAASTNNLAVVYEALGQYEHALPLYQRSLEIHEAQEDIDPDNTVNGISNLGGLYITLGQYEKALPLFHRAYQILQTAHIPPSLKVVQVNLANIYEKQGNISTAIFYLKGAVNTMQSIRFESRGLDKALQKSLLRKNEEIYNQLVDLLIGAGRLDEALQVLSMLKEEEYFDFIRRDAHADTRSTRMSYSGAEKPFAERLDKLGNDGAVLVDQLNTLDKQAKLGLTPEQEKQRTRIKAQLAEQTKQTIALLNELPQQLRAAPKQQKERGGKENLTQLQATLNSLGHGAVLLHYVVTDTRVRIILATPKALLAREAEIPEKELYRKIIAFRQVQQNPALDPRPQAQALYRLLIAPVADDLKKANAQTLMLSLDGNLRYLSMGALHDGEAYLAERYRLAMYTEVAKDNLREKPEAQWKVAGLGLTQKVGEFSALPSVRQELTGIVKGKFWESSGGVLPGDIYLDKDFTQSRLHEVLDRDYSVLHISSHFVFIPGTETQSFLLLGDGNQLSLAELRTGGWKFGSLDMMTLSACETARGGGRDENGREIEGFGALVQRQGAKGVLATLWPVADQSTAIFMQTLYRLRQEKGLTKAEALHEAQLALLTGKHTHPIASRKVPIIHNAGAATADAPAYTPDPAKPYAHPYYWAPFILMGNWL